MVRPENHTRAMARHVHGFDLATPETLALLAAHQVHEAEVGQEYDVPCVRHHEHGWLPVYGMPHTDPELFMDSAYKPGRGITHVHVDMRFVPVELAERLLRSPGWGFLIAPHTAEEVQSLRVERRRCEREWPTHSAPQWPTWAACRGQRLPASRLCPHRGLYVPRAPDCYGFDRCPGHGLAWDRETGEMVKRELAYPQSKQDAERGGDEPRI